MQMNKIYAGSKNASVWIENSCIGSGWMINNHHILTGIPKNEWSIYLPTGVCLDMTRIGDSLWCIKPYGFQDTLEGIINNMQTVWIEKPAKKNVFIRELLNHNLLDENLDLQYADIFPIIDFNILDDGGFIQALVSGNAFEYLDLYLSLPKLSTSRINERVKIDKLSILRESFRHDNLKSRRFSSNMSV